tara:strand:- start:410 stop:1819 length:1410 start_codon:yes stop_codon:yes gene_type:complete
MALTKVTYSMIYGSPVNVLDFGADPTGSAFSSAAFQSAIDSAEGRPILIPQGTYIFDVGLIYNTTGLGIAQGLKLVGYDMNTTILDNRTSGALITATNGASAGVFTDFQENVILEQFTISNANNLPNCIGVQLTGVRGATLNYLFVKNQTNIGIYLYSEIGDEDPCIHVDIKQCHVEGSTNSGIRVLGTLGGVHGAVNIEQCRVIDNGTGIDFFSAQNSNIQNCAIAYNSLFGVYITNDTGYSKECVISNNEFDSNGGSQLYIVNAVNTVVNGNSWVVNAGFAVTRNIDIAATAINVSMSNNRPRTNAGRVGLTMYYIDSGATTVSIEDTEWSSWVYAGNTRFSYAGGNTVVLSANKWMRQPVQEMVSEVSMPDNYAPDTSLGSIFRLRIDTAAARNLSAPLFPSNGQIITIIFINALGGALSLTLAAIYRQPSFTAPAAGRLITGQFYYDEPGLQWRSIGGWSADMTF